MAYVDLPAFRDFVQNHKTDDEAELQAAIDAACEYVGQHCGRITPTGVIGRGPSGAELYLEDAIITLTSITIGVTPLDLAAVTFTAGQTTIIANLPAGREVAVAYRAGYVEPPHWAIMGALIIAKHLWATRISRPAASPVIGAGFLVPNQAEAFLGTHRRTGGFA